jgi:CheY-like chemotaxis protein
MEKPLALIVEDNLPLNRIFSLALHANFTIASIMDGTEALEYLSSHIPDIIVLDLNLPGASGEEILKYVRASSRFTQVRVILATADSAKADELSQEADLVLLKPISPIQLQVLASRISSKNNER